MRNVKQYFL